MNPRAPVVMSLFMVFDNTYYQLNQAYLKPDDTFIFGVTDSATLCPGKPFEVGVRGYWLLRLPKSSWSWIHIFYVFIFFVYYMCLLGYDPKSINILTTYGFL